MRHQPPEGGFSLHEKKRLSKPVILVKQEVAPLRTIGFERKPVSDQRKIEIEGLFPSSNFRLWKAPWLQD